MTLQNAAAKTESKLGTCETQQSHSSRCLAGLMREGRKEGK